MLILTSILVTIDQVGAVLYFWGRENKLNLRIGYVVEGKVPQLLPHPTEDPAVIVWIHNNNKGNERTGALGHFSGMRPDPSFADSLLWDDDSD